jgi:hypothetical protein
MANKPQKLLTIILLMTLVISSTYTYTISDVHGKVTSTSAEKGITILNQVAGFDPAKYNITSQLTVNDPTFGVLSTEHVRYTLESDRNNVEILEKFTNGNLQILDVLENSGPFKMNHSPATEVLMAKTFSLNYQAYSIDSFYGQLSSMLNKVDSTKNSTTTVGNIRFDVTTTSGNSPMGNSTTFTWSYTSNGITYTGKCVSLGYKDGFLKNFIDTWNLYKIGSTTVTLSEKQAEDIAMKNARSYTWTIGSGNQTFLINNFNVTKPIVKEFVQRSWQRN